MVVQTSPSRSADINHMLHDPKETQEQQEQESAGAAEAQTSNEVEATPETGEGQ